MTSGQGPDFILDGELSLHGVSARLAWAKVVFGDPLQPAEGVELRQFFDGTVPPILLQRALCGDARLRAGSIASMLLADRRDTVAERLSALRATESRARREAVSARVRLESVQKINLTEPNPALRYSDVALERLSGDIVRAERAASRFAAAVPNAAVIAELLQLAAAEGQEAEFAMRAFGLAWKGRARLRAWQQARDPADLPRLPFGATEGAAAFSVPNAVLIPLEGGPGVPALVLLDRVAALYCLDLLWLAVDLARIAASDAAEDSWFPQLALPRVIVELCHALAREVPMARPGLLVDASDPNRIWALAEDAREWQPVADPPSPRRILRVAAEAARLLGDSPALFAADDMDGLVQMLTPADGASDPRPYLTVGLTDPVRKETNQLGERSLAESTWALVDGLARLDADLDTALGGVSRASHALWQLALLAHPGLPQRTDAERGRMLARLWRSMGRARPVSLLGSRYKAELSRLLKVAGEATPDRPFFYSIAPTANLIAAAGHGEEPDLLSGAVIADRVRLVEAINLTWKFVSGSLGTMHGATSREELEALGRNMGERFAPHEAELRLRLHRSWLASDREVWSLLRGRAPVVWDFWVKVLEGMDWLEQSVAAGPEYVLSHLLRVYGDLVRLMTVVEAWSPSGAERLDAGAEPASHALLGTLRRIERIGFDAQWPALRVAYEPLHAYFDETAVYDPWAAFVRSLSADIASSLDVLTHVAAEGVEGQRTLLTGLLARLAAVCATEHVSVGKLAVEAASTTGRPRSAVARPSGPLIGASQPSPLNEQDATAFFGFYVDLLEAALDDTIVFLKVLSLLRADETRKTVHDLARRRGPILTLVPEPADRAAILSYPSTPRRVLQLLFESKVDYREENRRSGAEQAKEYLTRAAEAHDELAAGLEGFGPLLDADKAVLDAWLASGASDRRLGYALVIFANRAFMSLHELESPPREAIDKLCAAAEQRLRSFPGVGSLEPFPAAGGFISTEKGKLVVTGGHPTFDPTFADPGQAASDSLLAHFAAARARAVRQALAESGIVCLVRG
jgi:hypothetical protein